MGDKDNEKYIQSEKEFEEARKQLVVKRVDSIQLGRNSFTLVEQKAVNYMISKIKPDDMPSTEYYFNIKEFCRMIQWHRTPTAELLGMLQNLANKSWWIKIGESGKAEYGLRHWFDIVKLNEGKGTITITFSKTVHPYLFNLLEQQRNGRIYLASWTTDAISLMKNKFSPRIFEQLRSFQFNNQKWEFENGTGTERDLQVIIADRNDKGIPIIPKGWANWATFRRDVLDPARLEINKYTDLMIDYEGIKTDYSGKKYRKYVRILFKLDEKTEEEKQKKDRDIAVEYENVISDREYEQISIFDLDDSFEAKRLLAKKRSDEKQREERYSRSKHPIFLEEMENNGFCDEKWVNTIYRKALQKLWPYLDIVGKDNEELWICDYVMEYLERMRSTGIATEVSEKARLFDLIDSDYRGLAAQITERYDRSEKVMIHDNVVMHEDAGEEKVRIGDEDLAGILLDRLSGK